MERTKLHHLAHGAPSGKQRNDQVTLWSLQSQQASVVVVISGVPWLSSSTPLNPLTNSLYSCSPAALFLSSTPGGHGHGGGQDPHHILSWQRASEEEQRAPSSCPHFLFSSPQRLPMLASPCLFSIFSPHSWPEAWNPLFISLCWLPES